MGYTADQKREYQRNWMRARRQEWISKQGGCVDCGSYEELEVDHVDPAQKEFEVASLWSRCLEVRERELAKCVVRCHECHANKTTEFRRNTGLVEVCRKIGPEGTAWCSGHQEFHPIAVFGSRADNWNGLREYCKRFRNEARKLGKQL
jgi:5-methylcytosine-specific restriction endonuclease McrA